MNVRRVRRGSPSGTRFLSRHVSPKAVLVAAFVSLVSWSIAVGAASPSPGFVPSTSSQSVHPYWVELTLPQRDALKPLADDWERLDVQTKKKWIEIANRYPRMQPDEQARTQQRMREWALLTPEQRRTARDSFARVRAMNPDQRADMLRKYQELPPERKQALTTEGQASRLIVVPKSMPMPVPMPRRAQLSEGAHVGPAIAAQKSASPMVAPAKKAALPSTAPPAAPTAALVPTPTTVPAPASTASPSEGGAVGPATPAAAGSTSPLVLPAAPAAPTAAP